MPEARKIAIPITYHTQYCTVPIGTVFSGCPLEEKHLPVLTYEGYKFIGWYYDEAFTQEAKVGDIVGLYNLYAKWVEVPTVKSKMTAIADEIRELSGTTGAMGLDDMAMHISEANEEVDDQVELLAQAVAALEGKAGGGGSGFDTITGTNVHGSLSVHYTNANGEHVSEIVEALVGTITVAKNTLVIVEYPDCSISGDVIKIPFISEATAFFACGDFEMDNM